VIIPLLPGNTSALGLAFANVRRERSQAVLAPVADLTDGEAAAHLDQLAASVVLGLCEDGVEPDAIALEAVARVCYEGQRYQIDVPIPTEGQWTAGVAFPGTLGEVAERFRERHRVAYGCTREEPISMFSLVVVGTAPAGVGGIASARADGASPDRPGAQSRSVWFSDAFQETPILGRHELPVGGRFEGPAVIEQPDSTTIVLPRWSGVVDPNGNLILTLQ